MTDTAFEKPSWWRYRMPFSIRLRGRDLTVRLGFTYPWPTWMRLNVGFRLHFGWDKDGELPGVHAWIDITRLHLYLHLGAGWQDEDGENRSLIQLGAYFQTYGIRYIGCWLGHDPERVDYPTAYFVSCKRCDKDIEHGSVEGGPA